MLLDDALLREEVFVEPMALERAFFELPVIEVRLPR